jgi:hypothetical protein
MSDPDRNAALQLMASSAPPEPDTLRKHSTPPPFPTMRLSRTARAALIGLRLFLGLTTAMAIYTFLHSHPL